MRKTNRQLRLVSSYVSALVLTAILCPSLAFASGNATFEFSPHCEGEEDLENVFGGPSPDVKGMTKLTEGTCHSFEVRDPSSLQTNVLKTGDTLDLDLIINNPDQKSINRFRAWISYDPTILEVMDFAISNKFPVPTPGEAGYSQEDGEIKISGTAESAQKSSKIKVAHIKFRVLADSYDGTPLTFIEATGNTDSKTGVFEGTAPAEQNILSTTIGSLFVRLSGTATDGSNSSTANGGSNGGAQVSQNSSSLLPHEAAISASSMAMTSSSASSVASKTTIFTMLQVLGLRVTTDGSSVFLVWDHLPSADLAGYNVYYGTVSGQYIQRRSVDKAANSLTIRALPVGTTYYFAVRAVNAAGEETVFSQEVGVSVGNPRTSTAPFNASTLTTKTPTTGGELSGETGLPSALVMLLGASAAIGTFIAFRRQFRTSL